MNKLSANHLARKSVVLAAVVIVAFLAGWSALGPAGGVMMAIALGAGCAVPVLREDRAECLPRLRRHRSRPPEH